MNTWLVVLWARLRKSFWFVPGLIVVLSAVSAWLLIAVDRGGRADWLTQWLAPEKASAEGVRSVLSTAATSVLTLGGLTFSATLVALTLATSQYGSRILRNFIRAVPNQVTLGVLLGNFVFCLIVLRAVRSAEEGQFIPHLATLAAFIATLASLAMFIHFVHYISVSLQADKIVSSVHAELDETIERFFPNKHPQEPEEQEALQEKEEWEEIDNERPIGAPKSGYIEAIHFDGLLEVATDTDLRCRVIIKPGQFVQKGADLIAIGGDPDENTVAQFTEQVLIGRIRTAEQDFEFCLRQLVEIALRALSPGINDPFTALNCIDYLGDAMGKVAGRRLPRRTFTDKEGHPRVRIRPTTFAGLLGAAFDQIRQTAGDRPDVAIRLLDVLGNVATRSVLDSHREVIREQVDTIHHSAGQGAECDVRAIDEAHQRARKALDGNANSGMAPS